MLLDNRFELGALPLDALRSPWAHLASGATARPTSAEASRSTRPISRSSSDAPDVTPTHPTRVSANDPLFSTQSWRSPSSRAAYSLRTSDHLACLRLRVVIGIEQAAQVVLAVGYEMPVGLVNLRYRCPHDPREVEQLNARGDRPGGERMAAGVGAPVLDARGAERRIPVGSARQVPCFQ